MGITLVKNRKHIVIKRDGREEEYNEEKMRKVLEWAIEKALREGFYKWDEKFITKEIINKLVDEVLQDTQIKIYDRIHISKLFDTVIETCENKISELQLIWDDVTKNLLVQKYYKEVWGIKRDEYPDYLEVVNKGVKYGIDIYKKIKENFTEEELKELGNYIKPERDFYMTSLGIKSFMSRYALKYTKNKWLELPQHTFMRLAIKSFMYESKELRINLIKERYDSLAESIITEATPRYNAEDMEASCVLIAMGDDTNSILRTVSSVALYSKFGGGTAVDVSPIRAIGSKIGKNGESDGVIPYIRMVETAILGFKQSGNKRRGACAVYFNWWHYEIEDLLMLKNEGGSEFKRARSLQYGIKLNRLFIDRVIKNEEITLFDPKETPELLENYGEEFEKWYKYYENKSGIRKKKIKARDLAYEIVRERLETGNIYVFFDDNVNEKSPFNEYIGQSNLCVSYETKLLTKEFGNIEIGKLVEEMKINKVTCWNGERWSETEVFRTDDGSGQEVYRVYLYKKELDFVNYEHGSIRDFTHIDATSYHKWYLKDGTEVRTIDLKPNQILQHNGLDKEDEYWVVGKIEKLDKKVPTYCGNEPLNHKLVFNNVLTGNCSEIVLPTKPSYKKSQKIIQNFDTKEFKIKETFKNGLIALCNLSSINVVEWSNLDEEEKRKVIYNLLRSHDNLIDMSFYPVKEGEIHNKMYRPIGIGISNLAYYFAKNKTKFTDDKVLKLQFDIMEDIAYHIYSASVELAKERGKFEWYNKTKWSKGWLPIKQYEEVFKKYADNWQSLRWSELSLEIEKYGVRFATHLAIAPTATSSLSIKGGSTESINPPKSLFAIKKGSLIGKQIVPQLNKFRQWYQTAYQVSNKRLLELAQIRQCFIDQAQSIDTFYLNPDSAFEAFKDIVEAERLGLKTLYYANSMKAEEKEVCESCSS